VKYCEKQILVLHGIVIGICFSTTAKPNTVFDIDYWVEKKGQTGN